MSICPRCLKAVTSAGIERGLIQGSNILNRRIPTRQLSLWSLFGSSTSNNTESPTPSPPSPSPPPPPPPPAAPQHRTQSDAAKDKLTEALKKAEEKRKADFAAAQKELELQYRAWGEADPVSEAVSPPFQDPLGHLTFEEQVAYLANPPDEYLRTLEERAKLREEFERELFMADPVHNWKWAYDVKPDLTGSTLPEWEPWNQDKMLEVMEKYRRYDERFQRKVQEIFESFGSAELIKRTEKQITFKIQKEIRANAAAAAMKQRPKGKKKKMKQAPPPVVVLEEPPLKVIERKVDRLLVKQRNEALNRLWHEHRADLVVFDDLNDEGLTVSEVRKKKVPEVLEQKKADEEKAKRAIKDWGALPSDIKVESVDWRAINGEM